MQLFMSFYFWTLHLIRRLIYSKQRQNLQDCNKPGAYSWHKRSQWHTVCSPSIARAIAARWVTPAQCHQLQRWATPGTHHTFPLGWGQEQCSTPPSCSKKPSMPSQWQVPPPCSHTEILWDYSSCSWSPCVLLSNVRSASKGDFPWLV